MKIILSAFLVILSFNAFATQYEVECENPFSFTTDKYKPSEVKRAGTIPSGTFVQLKTGATKYYSIANKCIVTEIQED